MTSSGGEQHNTDVELFNTAFLGAVKFFGQNLGILWKLMTPTITRPTGKMDKDKVDNVDKVDKEDKVDKVDKDKMDKDKVDKDKVDKDKVDKVDKVPRVQK